MKRGPALKFWTSLSADTAMVTLRMIGKNDYSVRDDGQRIGRIRYANKRTPSIWQWHVQVHMPSPPFGDAEDIDQAKVRFKAAWLPSRPNTGRRRSLRLIPR